MTEEMTDHRPSNPPAAYESFANRVRETLITGALLCIGGVLLRFFAPLLAGKNDALFLRTNALYHISIWIFILGGLLLILCFAFWLADGMLANRPDNRR